MEHEGDYFTNCDWCFWHGNKRIIIGTRTIGSWRLSGDYSNRSIIENCQNTEKNPGALRILAITQSHVKTISLRFCEKL